MCGKVGQIQSVTKNGDFEVKVEDKTWLFNPLALIPCTRDESCSGRTISESDKEKGIFYYIIHHLEVYMSRQ